RHCAHPAPPPPPHSPYHAHPARPVPTSIRLPPRPTLFPYTTLFRSLAGRPGASTCTQGRPARACSHLPAKPLARDSVRARPRPRSEEHTSELQSLTNLVCRLLLEKKKHGPESAQSAVILIARVYNHR